MLLSARLCFAMPPIHPLSSLPAAGIIYSPWQEILNELSSRETCKSVNGMWGATFESSVSPNEIGIDYRFMAMCVTDTPALNNNAPLPVPPFPYPGISCHQGNKQPEAQKKKINKCKKGISQPLIIMTKAQITVSVCAGVCVCVLCVLLICKILFM